MLIDRLFELWPEWSTFSNEEIVEDWTYRYKSFAFKEFISNDSDKIAITGLRFNNLNKIEGNNVIPLYVELDSSLEIVDLEQYIVYPLQDGWPVMLCQKLYDPDKLVRNLITALLACDVESELFKQDTYALVDFIYNGNLYSRCIQFDGKTNVSTMQCIEDVSVQIDNDIFPAGFDWLSNCPQIFDDASSSWVVQLESFDSIKTANQVIHLDFLQSGEKLTICHVTHQ